MHASDVAALTKFMLEEELYMMLDYEPRTLGVPGGTAQYGPFYRPCDGLCRRVLVSWQECDTCTATWEGGLHTNFSDWAGEHFRRTRRHLVYNEYSSDSDAESDQE